jgi:hypothetical protein
VASTQRFTHAAPHPQPKNRLEHDCSQQLLLLQQLPLLMTTRQQQKLCTL